MLLINPAYAKAPQEQQTPSDVAKYLSEHGWYSVEGPNGPLWTYKDHLGYLSWEQALIYVTWKRLYMGAV